MSSHLATGQILDRYSYLQNASTHVGLLQVSSELLETGSHVSWAQGLDDTSILPHIKNGSTTDLHVRPDTLKRLYQSLRISPLFLDGVIVPNPWAKLGQASFVHPGEGGKSDTIECFYQYLNGWNGGPSSVWFSYDPNAGSSTYVLWDCPEFARRHIVSQAQEDPLSFVACHLMIDAFVASECANSWQNLVDGPRYFDERLTFLIGLGNTCRSISTTQTTLSAIETLVYFQSRNRIWKRWVEHYNERARLMINLFFNIGTQVDSRTNLEIANLTSKIAVDAHRDSSSMITIAAVTMIFLPGTFISAVFSMAFFNASTDTEGKAILEVSPLWWYYPAITIPLTILVLIIWELWRRKRQASRAPNQSSERDTPTSATGKKQPSALARNTLFASSGPQLVRSD
ncbi:MAG: hypothetical protein Q9202_001410 [Teloschistes flavicans]